MKNELAGWRAQIDEVDRDILRLLSRRARLVAEVGELKRESGRAVYDPLREADILARMRRENPGPFSDEAVARLFTAIIHESRRFEAELVNLPRPGLRAG
jgi:chorismate mutase-like protein